MILIETLEVSCDSLNLLTLSILFKSKYFLIDVCMAQGIFTDIG